MRKHFIMVLQIEEQILLGWALRGNNYWMELYKVVDRVGKEEVGQKIICGRAAKWWDEELKDKLKESI